MTKNLCAFSFDKAKAGQILKRYIENSGFSQRQLAQHIGMTDDMMSNVLRGQNKEISLERVFKICIATGHSICDFVREMLEWEEIDFRAEFDAVCPPHCSDFADDAVNLAVPAVNRGVVVRQTEVVAQKTEVLAQKTEIIKEENHPLYESIGADVLAFLRADRAEQAQRTNEIHDAYTLRLVEQYKDQIQQLKDSRQITIDHYEDRVKLLSNENERHIQDIKDSHAATIKAMEESHNRSVEYLKAESTRLRKWVIRLAVILGIESVAVLGVFTLDALNRNIGWIRGLTPNTSGNFFDSLLS